MKIIFGGPGDLVATSHNRASTRRRYQIETRGMFMFLIIVITFIIGIKLFYVRIFYRIIL